MSDLKCRVCSEIDLYSRASVAIHSKLVSFCSIPVAICAADVPSSTNELINCLGFLFVTNGALANLFAGLDVVSMLGYCPIAPSVLAELASGFATSCTCFGNKTSSSLPVVTKCIAFNCATDLTGLGSFAGSGSPIVICAKVCLASVALMVAVFVGVTKTCNRLCVCMISVVSTCVCLNAVFCTSRSCCYFASVVVSILVNGNFFCLNVTARAGKCLNARRSTCSRSSYLGCVIVLMNEGILSPFACAIVPSVFLNYVAVSIICRNNEVRCLIPLVIPIVSCRTGIHTAEDYIGITLIDVCFPNAVAILISHIDPKLAVTEEINCKSCIIDLPISIGNEIENYCNLGFNRFFDLYNLNSKIAIEINRELICSGNFN